jgi:rod shape-determining protein MreD
MIDQQTSSLFIVSSFLVAFLMMAFLLFLGVSVYYPHLVVLVLLYWLIFYPEKVGVWVAFVVGLFLDVFYHELMGMNAFCLVVLSYLIFHVRLRLRHFPLLQQSGAIFIMVGIYQLQKVLFLFLTQTVVSRFDYYVQALMSGAVWPFVFILLNGWLRHARENYSQ